MTQIKRVWHYLLVKPFTWIFYCFFQPFRFANEFERQRSAERIGPMLRLILPIFLIAYPLALVVQIILYKYGFLEPYPGWSKFLSETIVATIVGILWGVIVGFIGNISLGIVLGVGLGMIADLAYLGTTNDIADARRMVSGLAVAIALGLVGGTASHSTWGMPGGIISGLVGGAVWGISGSQQHLLIGFEVTMALIASYTLGYYRLPLYPISGLSSLKADYASRKRPRQVFTSLHRSALYWDECVYPPLPGLKRTLLTAVGQNTDLTLKEIAFIVAQRPQQIGAARIALLEIAIHEVEVRNDLFSIAQASHRLAEILSEDVGQIVPLWIMPFTRLSDASREAARYASPLDRRTRRIALEDMISNLNQINPNTTSEEEKFNSRLANVVNRWLQVAQREQDRLAQEPQDIGQIENPFIPGEVLKPEDSRFVGRSDIVQLLQDALSRESGRPTFFLTGERRMGKSSTLKQLPKLLGARYLPVGYDLQMPGICSSATALLSTIAEEIFKVLQARGMQTKRLNYELLQRASQQNEAAIYVPFDTWLRSIEHILEQHNRTLLLAFDEFEKLEEARQAGYLKLPLLLDWFRSVIQNRSRLALLFSGVHSVSEMDIEENINWSTYFVNVQTLKVGFLKRAEAHKLITKPQPDFPSERIFSKEVVDEIIVATGCHPFLIQAVCSTIINYLNAEERDRAEKGDVKTAINQVLDNWNMYFQDLWQRTEQEQRICLITLRSIGQGNTGQIVQQTVLLDEKTVQQTLQTLLKRDLVLCTNGNYQIAAPIFSEWVERNR